MIIGKLIADYLATNNRIIIPQFGAFIKRPDGEIVFMSLLKTDDGVLCRLVAEAQEISDAEARRQIDIYATRNNDMLAAQNRASLEGFGYVVIGDKGDAVFTTDKSLFDGKSTSGTGRSGSIASEDDDGIITESVTTPASTQPKPKQEQRRAIIELFDDENDEPAQPAARPSRNYSAPPPSTERYGGQSYTRSGQEQRGNANQSKTQPRQNIRPNQDNRPRSSEQVDETRTWQDRPKNASNQEQRDRVNIRRPQRRKGKVDLVVIIAMLAILVAIIVMIYGMGGKERHVVLDEELYNTSVVEGGIPIESVYME